MSLLHVQTALNLNSIIEIKNLFEKAKNEGLKAIGITDDGTLHHLYEVSKMVKETGIKAIIGSKFEFKMFQSVVPVALYPRNEKGKQHLMWLSTTYQRGDRKPLTLDKMKSVFEEMNIVIDAETVDSKVVLESIKSIKELVNGNQVYVGLHETFNQTNKERNLQIKEVMKKEKIGFVAFNKVLFLEEEQFEPFCNLMLIRGMEPPEDIDNVFLSDGDIKNIFDYMEDMEEQASKIVNCTDVSYEMKKSNIKLPAFAPDDGFEIRPGFKSRFEKFMETATKEEVQSSAYLFNKVSRGIVERYGRENREAGERALHELGVIIEKKIPDYFLIVADMINHAKENGLIVGPGRGSSVGSIVCYALGITEVCPLEYNLQFERFLSKERTKLPDIDIDVSQKTRDAMIRYIIKKYGAERVSHIVTRSNFGFKNIITYTLKYIKVPTEKVEKMMSYKPYEFSNYREFLLKADEECLEFIRSCKDINVLLNTAYSLKDIPQTTSTHAAGIIISSRPLEEEMPMMFVDGRLMTQIPNDDNSLEEMGFLKVDVLGLRYLDVKRNAEKLVEKREGKTFPEIPLNDEKTLSLFREGNLSGVFQMESVGMSASARKIGISSFDEIVILNALYRPGPMEMIDVYKERKGKPIKMVGVDGNELEGCEDLFPILEPTNGIIVFQEQINSLVCKWAGYNLADAELFRQAISKKDEDKLIEEEANFIMKSIQSGRDEQTSREIYRLILKFADYGFNRSHAVAYSKTSFETAFLKIHFPKEYMASLLTSVIGDSDKLSAYIEESRRLGVKVLAVDVNESTDEFEVNEEGIRCALPMVSNVGIKTAKMLVELRGNRPFRSFSEFLNRVQNKGIDKRTIERLIRVGALDSLGKRHEMLNLLTGEETKEFTLGMKIMDELKYSSTIFSLDEELKNKFINKKKDKEGSVVGVLTSLIPWKDKYKQDMAKFKVTDFEGNVFNLVMFHSLWKKEKNKIKEGSIVFFQVEDRVIKEAKSLML